MFPWVRFFPRLDVHNLIIYLINYPFKRYTRYSVLKEYLAQQEFYQYNCHVNMVGLVRTATASSPLLYPLHDKVELNITDENWKQQCACGVEGILRYSSDKT